MKGREHMVKKYLKLLKEVYDKSGGTYSMGVLLGKLGCNWSTLSFLKKSGYISSEYIGYHKRKYTWLKNEQPSTDMAECLYDSFREYRRTDSKNLSRRGKMIRSKVAYKQLLEYLHSKGSVQSVSMLVKKFSVCSASSMFLKHLGILGYTSKGKKYVWLPSKAPSEEMVDDLCKVVRHYHRRSKTEDVDPYQYKGKYLPGPKESRYEDTGVSDIHLTRV